jgi:hypothetical protein
VAILALGHLLLSISHTSPWVLTGPLLADHYVFRNCPMIHQFGLMACCGKSRPAQAKVSYAKPQPVIAIDTIYDIQTWQSKQPRESNSEGKRVSGWMRLSFWKQPKDKLNRYIMECSGQDEEEAISKVVYTITNVGFCTFSHLPIP